MTETHVTKSADAMGYQGPIVFSVDVSDLHKAIAWYGEVLGLEPAYVMEEIGWCELKTFTPGVTIGLSQAEQVKLGNTTPVFEVKDIEKTRLHLEGRQVRFDGPTRDVAGMTKLVTFYDPDGNSYMLSQSLMGGPA